MESLAQPRSSGEQLGEKKRGRINKGGTEKETLPAQEGQRGTGGNWVHAGFGLLFEGGIWKGRFH